MSLKRRFSNFNENFRMLYTDPSLNQRMSEKIISWMPEIPRDYVIVCIGTDRSTGDSLGPLTGTFLNELKLKHMTVYGTLHQPVHATNLHETMEMIMEKHKNPYIIAIDACLGKNSSIGHLIAAKGPLKPGAALNKTLPLVGDMHITAVVNIGGFMEYSVLQNTRLSFVMDMAKQLANVLDFIDQHLKHHYPMSIVLRSNSEEKRTI
ncbi:MULTISPECIES: spore protease YyaC [Oceanobacillus]|uniref:spore protease YyaC n=1 Tax=Oceanobacillus TaxID=182709 RepID=UPI001C2351DD|nr:spore protease YyaC [Oceanobacillus caeni]MBU8790864.1 spore protease YyaC [Oceanobacillus caeni]MED4473320.1 spore protease YyaC [Oceanobacillus caeni]